MKDTNIAINKLIDDSDDDWVKILTLNNGFARAYARDDFGEISRIITDNERLASMIIDIGSRELKKRRIA